MHLNLIVCYWSILCRTDRVENNQLQLGIVTFNVLTGDRTTVNLVFRKRESPYFCVGDSVWITADYP